MSILSSISPRRAAFAVALGGALVLALAGPVAAGDKPGPAKKPATGAPPAAAKPAGSLEDITKAYDKEEEDARKALRRQRYEATVAYVKANGTAKDAEEARKSLVDLAEELEEWALVVQHADEFAAAHAASKQRVEALLSKAQAQGNLGKAADAKATYEGLTKSVKMDVDGPQVAWAVWSGYAELLADDGDVEGAKKAYETAQKDVPHPQVAQLATRAIESLELIGTEPVAFPDGAKDMGGKALSLKDFAGKVLLIDFWATWCGPCRRELPNVVACYDKLHAKGFEIVGVTLDEKESEGKVKEFLTSNKMPWRQFFDGEGWNNEIAKLYAVHSIPHTVLLGKDGKVARMGVRGKALERAVEKLLAAK